MMPETHNVDELHDGFNNIFYDIHNFGEFRDIICISVEGEDRKRLENTQVLEASPGQARTTWVSMPR